MMAMRIRQSRLLRQLVRRQMAHAGDVSWNLPIDLPPDDPAAPAQSYEFRPWLFPSWRPTPDDDRPWITRTVDVDRQCVYLSPLYGEYAGYTPRDALDEEIGYVEIATTRGTLLGMHEGGIRVRRASEHDHCVTEVEEVTRGPIIRTHI